MESDPCQNLLPPKEMTLSLSGKTKVYLAAPGQKPENKGVWPFQEGPETQRHQCGVISGPTQMARHPCLENPCFVISLHWLTLKMR